MRSAERARLRARFVGLDGLDYEPGILQNASFGNAADGRRRRIYLSGPMTGIDRWNAPAFAEAARELRALPSAPLVFNPAEMLEQGAEDAGRAACMRADMLALLAADEVRLLYGWPSSRGALLEALIAFEIGIPVLDVNGNPIDLDEADVAAWLAEEWDSSEPPPEPATFTVTLPDTSEARRAPRRCGGDRPPVPCDLGAVEEVLAGFDATRRGLERLRTVLMARTEEAGLSKPELGNVSMEGRQR